MRSSDQQISTRTKQPSASVSGGGGAGGRFRSGGLSRYARVAVACTVAFLGLVTGGSAATEVVNQTPEMKRLLSRLQSMGHGYYPAREWNAVVDEIHEMLRASEEIGNFEQMIDVTAVLANVYSQMLHNHNQAIKVIQEMQEYLADRDVEGMPKLFARKAEVYGKIGDVAAIDQLIKEFRESKYYDPKDYAVTAAENYGEQWAVERPHGQGDNSLTVSAMKKALKEARFAPGGIFPDLSVTTVDGREIQLSSLKGKLVLVDFWIKDWTAWNRDLPHLVKLYERHHPAGFEIIGVSVQPGMGGQQEYLLRQGARWPQVQGSRELFSACGVTGDATNFLLDPDGVIIGRNLRSNEISNPIRDYLK